jgi:hypothetical protein
MFSNSGPVHLTLTSASCITSRQFPRQFALFPKYGWCMQFLRHEPQQLLVIHVDCCPSTIRASNMCIKGKNGNAFLHFLIGNRNSAQISWASKIYCMVFVLLQGMTKHLCRVGVWIYVSCYFPNPDNTTWHQNCTRLLNFHHKNIKFQWTFSIKKHACQLQASLILIKKT